MSAVLAIDPGSAGGFCFFFDGVHLYPMPDTEGDILSLIQSFNQLAGNNPKTAIVESQQGVVGPKMKVSASAMFTFGNGYGFIRGALQAIGWRMEHVRPMAWQKALSLGKKKDYGSRTAWKNHCKQVAQRLHPGLNVTLKTADALLIMEYYLLTRVRTATLELENCVLKRDTELPF